LHFLSFIQNDWYVPGLGVTVCKKISIWKILLCKQFLHSLISSQLGIADLLFDAYFGYSDSVKKSE